MDTIKLTDAQLAIFQSRQLEGAHVVRTEPITLEITDRELFTAQVTAAVEDIMTWKYSEETAREIFATRYLLRKLTGEKPQTVQKEQAKAEPVSGTVEAGTLVYLIDDNDGQDFKVIKTNRDGSMQIYGGSTHYRQFRDFTTDRLTTTRPAAMPKLRD